MSLLDNLPHRITHLRSTQVRIPGTMRHLTEQPAIKTGVASWVQNASSSEILEWEKRDQKVSHKAMFASDPAADVGDYFLVTSGPSFVGKRLKLLSVTDRSAGLGRLFTAMCEEER